MNVSKQWGTEIYLKTGKVWDRIARRYINKRDETYKLDCIKRSKYAIKVINRPTPQMVRTHNALWEL